MAMRRWGQVFLPWVLSGCAGLSGAPGLTLVSRQPLQRFYEPVGERVSVEACRYNMLLVGFAGNAAPSHTEVVGKALEEAGADILLDATVSSVHWPFVLFNRYCTRVEGQPAVRRAVPLPREVAPPPSEPAPPLPELPPTPTSSTAEAV